MLTERIENNITEIINNSYYDDDVYAIMHNETIREYG